MAGKSKPALMTKNLKYGGRSFIFLKSQNLLSEVLERSGELSLAHGESDARLPLAEKIEDSDDV